MSPTPSFAAAVNFGAPLATGASPYQDQLQLVSTGLVGPLDRNQNQTNFHPMVRTDWQISDRIRGVLGASFVELPLAQGKGSLLKNTSLSLTGLTAPRSWWGPVADQFVGNNGGTNIVFDYSLNTAQDAMTLTFSEAGWKSYEITGIVADWFDPEMNQGMDLSEVTALVQQTEARLNSYIGVGEGPSTAQGLLWGPGAMGPFFDHATLLYLPSPNAAIRSKAEARFNVEPTYNQYVDSVPSYEKTIAPDAVAEHILPNAYYLQFELENTESTLLANGRYKQALSLNDQAIPLGLDGEDRRWFQADWSVLIAAGVPNAGPNNVHFPPELVGQVWAVESNIGRFYETYSQALAAASNENLLPGLAETINRDLMVLYRDRDTLTEDVINPEAIPFYNKITIPTSNPSVTAMALRAAAYSALDGQDFIDMLQYLAVQSLAAGGTSTDFRVATKTITSAGDTPDYTYSTSTPAYENVYNISAVIADLYGAQPGYAAATADLIEDDAQVTDSSVAALHRRGLNDDYTIYVNPDVTDAIDIFTPLLQDHTRNFQEILNNQSCHTETLMFVVKKYRGDSATPAQTFYFTNRFDGQDIIFYDSQIKAKQKYRYTFERVMLIFGNEYSYSFPAGANDIDFQRGYYGTSAWQYQAQLNINISENIKTCLVPYVAGAIVTIVEDKPPTVPEISFYPFLGVNNQVKILLNASVGITNEKPIAILEEDKSFFADEYLAQTGLPAPYDNIETIEFRSDDPVDAYTLFRLTTKPTSYREFESAAQFSVDPARGIPGAFTDTIRPNTKYYYCARAVDINGNISNPTHIFEIEMIDNAGQIFLRQDIIQFESSQPEYTKTGQRYIYIEPSMLQLSLSDPTTVGTPSVTNQPISSILGPTAPIIGADKVWEKKFKIRTTSKKTGRKLDLNITFKNTGIVNPSE